MISSILFSIFCTLTILVFVIECWKEYLNYTKLKGFFYSRGLPVLGKMIDFVNRDGFKAYQFVDSLTERFDGKMCYTWIGPELFFATEDPQTFEIILKSDNFLGKPYMFEFFRNRIGLVTAASVDIWKPYRRALNPTLGPKVVKSFMSIFNEKSKRMVDLMERDIGKTIDLYRMTFKYATDTIFRTACGVNFPMQNARGDFMMDKVLQFFASMQLRIDSVLMRFDFIYQLTKQWQLENMVFSQFRQSVNSVIELKKTLLADKLMDGIDELAIAKENGNMNWIEKCLQLEQEGKIDMIDVREQVETILVAGMDSTGFTINTVILMLAMHPEYQERVFIELHSLFRTADDPVTSEHLSLMTFTDLVVKETMRLFPVVPHTARKCANDFAMQGGVIPKGSQIILNIYKSQNNPKYWGQNAHQFYPERFLPENRATFHPYQYIPFSAGIRNCIGMRYALISIKIALAYLLRRYTFSTELKMHEIEIETSITMKIVNGNKIQFERREW